MLLALLLSISGAATPATLASPDFSTLNVSKEVAQFCNEHLAQQLASHGVQVTTARQISALLGLERQRQLLGCDESANSCMTELAAALGVDGMLLGDLGRLGTKIQVNLRVAKSRDGQVFATWSRTVEREEQLLAALSDAADELAPKIIGELHPTAPKLHSWPLVPTLIAGGLAIASGIAWGVTAGAHSALVDPSQAPGSLSDERAGQLVVQGNTAQWIAIGSAIGVGVCLGLSVILYALGHEAPLQTALAPWLSSRGWGLR